MRVLSWNQIHANAARFAEDWKDAHYEKGHTQTFYNEFFEVFGHRRRNVALYEKKVEMVGRSHGFIDLFWPGMLVVEQKSAGRNLESASTQADDYILALKERERPRYRLVSDFQNFIFTDLETREAYSFAMAELKDNIKLFDFIAGRRQQIYKDQDPVNIDASDKMTNLHKVLEEAGYHGTDLERLLVRIMFCLFADDTGIFEQDLMLNYIRDRTSEDGSDLGGKLIELFQVLDTPKQDRYKTLDEDLAAFPYVNGKLFNGLIRTPPFNSKMRDVLLDCCYFNWTQVSPALFGSLFQTVMLPIEQRQDGAHYTSERNILKTIQPLFLDELRDEFERLKHLGGTQRRSKIEQFHQSLGHLTFFDPACGCGNFLILAYRELRLLELDILNELYPKDSNGYRAGLLDVEHLSVIDVDQFYGIEINEFPVYVAQTAMWLVDHQMNMKLGDMFGQAYARLPLQKSAIIYHGNALTTDWNDVIPASKCSYILGNPPFIGHHLQEKEQKKEMTDVLSDLKAAGVMDYISAWFMLASQYIQNTKIQVAFVSTNSITQGEQASILWKMLIDKYGTKINFAHRTFKWTIDEQKAKGMKIAAVYCVIIGFSNFDKDQKTIFEYETITSDPQAISAKNISPYLIDAEPILITNQSKSICDVPAMMYGSKPTDGGQFILSDEERENFITNNALSEKYIKKYLNASDFLNGRHRWVLWLVDASAKELNSMTDIMARINAVKEFRSKSKAASTRNYKYHTLFRQVTQPKSKYILVPSTTSENREYVPMGFFNANVIISNACFAIPNANLFHLGVLQSKMHMDWMRLVAGRLKGDYRYSKDIVYNNFPWPDLADEQKKAIVQKAQAVLDARENHPDSTLAELYNPTLMPVDLRKAHNDLDKAVDKAYRKKPFESALERIQFLFERYQKLTEPLTAEMNKKPKRSRKKKAS